MLDNVKANIEAVYSQGLGEFQAQEYELEHIKRKLELLTNARQHCEEWEQKRLDTALRLTNARAEMLRRVVSKE